MKEVKRYICEICKTEHKSKKKALTCEAECTAELEASQKKLKRINTAQQEFIDSIKFPEDVAPQTVMWMKKWNNIDLEIIEENLEFQKLTSNTHCSPINGIKNWWGKDDSPKGYPGWRAHWVFGINGEDYKNTKVTFFSDFFDGWLHNEDLVSLKRIHSGSGGGWTTPDNPKKEVYLHYYMTFFVDDFPGLKKWFLIKELRDEVVI